MIRYRLSPQLLWALLVGQLAVLIPYLTLLPPWIYFVFGGAALWRLMVAYGYWSLPKKGIVYGIAILSLPITLLNSGWSRETAVALLALTFSLKLLELKALRDSMIIIFLGFFLLAVCFLYSNSMGATLYIFAVFVFLTLVLIGLNRIGDILPIGGVLQKALLLLLSAIPLALITFVLFQGIEIPLWIPNLNGVGVSGFSRTLEPGSISQLAQSDRVVFRAKFEEKEPLQKNLYWRGLVLSAFDGQRWSVADARNTAVPPPPTSRLPFLSYEVFLEPTHHVWLFVIEKLLFAKGEVVAVPEERLEAKSPVQKRFTYQAASVIQPPPSLSRKRGRMNERLDFVKLPEKVNPESRQLAKKLFAKASGDPSQYIKWVLNHLRTNAYVYTLNPPRLSGENTIDDFLLHSKKGFCEHYATAFTFLMRAMQIPARVVVGYQGGDFNPYTNYWTVREYHAHAWSEVWLPDGGWVRVDPTEAVSPGRIELGVDEDVKAKISKNTHSFLRAWLESSRKKPYFSEFLWGVEAVETFWQSVVVDYRGVDQKSLLQWFSFSSFSWTSFVLVLTLLIGSMLIFLSVVFLPKREEDLKQNPILKAYHLFCLKLAKIGIMRRKGEGPRDFVHRVVRARPDLKEKVEEINELYISLQYQGLCQDKETAKTFYKKVRRLSLPTQNG